jgi:hypothetical protein
LEQVEKLSQEREPASEDELVELRFTTGNGVPRYIFFGD